MPEDKRDTRAPYNFVPFAERILEYNEELPPHNVLDPVLKTGEIHMTMTAQTPVFVSDGGKEDPHFFRTPDGRLALPGSTVRGMTRANMQVLGFGAVLPGDDLEDRRLYYREFSAAAKALRYELRNHYAGGLNIEFGRTLAGHHYSNPKNVLTGYLRRTGAGYEIRPAECFRVTKDLLKEARLDRHYAEAIPVDYELFRGDVSRIQRARDAKPASGMLRGCLLCPGVDTGGDGTRKNKKPPAHRYVFGEVRKHAVAIPVPKEDEISYRVDWENRKNDLKGGTQIEGRKILYDPDFWKMPEKPGEEKPVFYLRYQGHVYFGMSRMLRLGYDRTLAEGLPPQHKALEEDNYPYDYIRAILGFAGKKTSYRSRAFFCDFYAEGDPQEGELFKTILGGPKPSWFAGYTVDGRHYNDKNFRLRGYKRYWMKETETKAEAAADKEKAAAGMRPLPAGTVFRGIIRFKNLQPHELGLLLWALRLEDGCFQSAGMGKPFGFGRMTLTVDRLLEYDMDTLYRDLAAGPAEAKPEAVDAYIQEYQTFAKDALGVDVPIRELPEIKDFFYLCSRIQTDEVASYMQIGDSATKRKSEYQNLAKPLPTVADLREPEESAQKMAEQSQLQKKREEEEKQRELKEQLEMLEKLKRWSNKI